MSYGLDTELFRVYLAGPGVFRPDAMGWGDYLKGLCKERGFEGLYPLDQNVPEILPPESKEAAEWIKRANCNLIHKADAIIADVSPFRGPNCDPGTAYECGYAEALGKFVFYYTKDQTTFLNRIWQWSFGKLKRDASEAFDMYGQSIESFPLVENLMIASLPARGPYKNEVEALDAVQDHLIKLRAFLRD